MKEGVRLDSQPTNYISEGSFRPLRDHILVKPLDWEPSKVIKVAGDKRKPLRGRVVAVGPGCFCWRYNKDRSKRWESAVFRPTEVEVGDIVELGGLERDGIPFPQLIIGTELHIIAREEDVCGIC